MTINKQWWKDYKETIIATAIYLSAIGTLFYFTKRK